MSISKDLFLAILSMDAYNRGYDSGVSISGDGDTDGLGGVGSKIGWATVSKESDVTPNSPGVDKSFYALAYDIGSSGPAGLQNSTVISYRGTDKISPWPFVPSDIWHGWTLGAGWPETADQGQLAIRAFSRRLLKQLVLSAFFIASANVVMAMATGIGGNCEAPTDAELIDLAIAEMVGPDPASVSITQTEGPTIGLRLAPYPTSEAYLEANPDCCTIVTQQTLTEALRPEDASRLNYLGSVRIETTFKVIENTHPELHPSDVFSSVRVFDFDICGRPINLE